MEKPKPNKRRVLVVIDGDSLAPKVHYDFNFLESEKRLDLWLFFSQKIPHSFSIYREYNAKNILLPRYEEDSIPYILKRVCYEIGRRREKYYKIYFIGGSQSAWEGLVQFFRERGYIAHHMLASDYAVSSAEEVTPPPKQDKAAKDVRTEESQKLGEKRRPGTSEALSSETTLAQVQPTQSSRTSLPASKAQEIAIPPAIWDNIVAEIRKIEPGRRLIKKGFTVLLHQRGLAKGLSKAQIQTVLPRLIEMGLARLEPDSQEVVILPSHD